MKKQKKNITIQICIDELNLNITHEFYSADMQQLINTLTNNTPSVEITDRQSEFFELLVSMWEEDALKVGNRKVFTSLATFIYRHVAIRRKNVPSQFMKLSSLKTELYKYLQKSGKKK